MPDDAKCHFYPAFRVLACFDTFQLFSTPFGLFSYTFLYFIKIKYKKEAKARPKSARNTHMPDMPDMPDDLQVQKIFLCLTESI